MPESDLALLTRAAREAGEVALRYHGPTAKRWDKPGGAGPVTEADLAVNEALRAILLGARPDYGWLSEEDADTPERLDHPHIFLLDPIDGTTGFIEGSSSWSLSLAVVTEGEITAAVVYLPADKGKLYAAARGEGATLDGRPIRATARESVEGADVLATRAAMEPRNWPGGVPGFKRHHRPSLAYRLALVAEGRFDAMITHRDSWDWDIAAGLLICREAGAVVTDRAGDPPRFNTANPRTPGIVAAGASVHAGLIAAMRPRG